MIFNKLAHIQVEALQDQDKATMAQHAQEAAESEEADQFMAIPTIDERDETASALFMLSQSGRQTGRSGYRAISRDEQTSFALTATNDMPSAIQNERVRLYSNENCLQSTNPRGSDAFSLSLTQKSNICSATKSGLRSNSKSGTKPALSGASGRKPSYLLVAPFQRMRGELGGLGLLPSSGSNHNASS